MSANVLTFRLKKEVELNKDLKPIDGSDESVGLYACTDGIWALVSDITSIGNAREMIQPNNIENLFIESLSDVEYETIMGVLNYHPEYYFFDEVYNYKDKK